MTFWIGLGAIILLFILVSIFFIPLASLFTNDEAVQDIMLCIFGCLMSYQLGDCLQITYGNALRGLGYTKPLPIIASISYMVICIPLSYFYTFKYSSLMKSLDLDFLIKGWSPEMGLWIGIPFGLLTAGLLFHRVFKKKLWSLMEE